MKPDFKESAYSPLPTSTTTLSFKTQSKKHGRDWLRYQAISLLPPNASFTVEVDIDLLADPTLCLDPP